MNHLKLSCKALLIVLGLHSLVFAQTLTVEIGQSRSPSQANAAADAAVRTLNRNLAKLTRQNRHSLARAGRYFPNVPVSFPATVWLTSQGKRLPAPTRSPSRAPAPLTLVFDGVGGNAFSATYQQFLQDVYTKAQPFLDSLFGAPSIGGNVQVWNYDADMGDRDYTSGGYYIPNGGSGPRIAFPVYGDVTFSDPNATTRATTAINFIHCLLLAYIGPTQYGFDAFNEGIVRAVVMRVARTGAFTNQLSLDTDSIEQVLTNTYDVEGFYDWYNQRALGGSTFIAPNLRSVPLPEAGSFGGLFLMRYKMSGSAWTKLLVEAPGFISRFNSGFYASPGIASNIPALVALGQTSLNLERPGDPTIEGLSFAEWFKRQYILETKNTRGTKLLIEPVPVTSGLSGSDFGVFILHTNWFETGADGNETLLSGTSYPILWEGNLNFSRFFPSAPEDEIINIAGGWGAVVPNMRSDINGGQPYRAAVDVPVQDKLARVYLPAGAIATASQQNPRDFFGTVTGADLQAGDTLKLLVSINDIPYANNPVTVQNNAFGTLINTGAYLGNARIKVDVVRTRSGSDTTLLTRKINKGPGSLGLDLRVQSEITFGPVNLPKGISAIGFPVDPFLSLNSAVLGINDDIEVLAARYNPSKARYDLYPDMEPFTIGHGYFVRMEATQPAWSVEGRIHHNVTATVALKPGWNMISGPLLEAITTNRVIVVKTNESPMTWDDAIAQDIGSVFFKFTPGPPDAITGAPETGTLEPATTFEVGGAYYVRVLAPEGLTLAFQQTGSTSFNARAAIVNQTGWRLGVTMTNTNKQKATVILGQSTTATRSFDPREDAGMPPGLGGFQVIVEDYESMYRDVRPLVGGEVYTLHLQGLKVGKMYPISFQTLLGNVPNLSLRDSKGRNLGQIRAGMTYSHFAKSSDEYIQVVVGGSR